MHCLLLRLINLNTYISILFTCSARADLGVEVVSVDGDAVDLSLPLPGRLLQPSLQLGRHCHRRPQLLTETTHLPPQGIHLQPHPQRQQRERGEGGNSQQLRLLESKASLHSHMNGAIFLYYLSISNRRCHTYRNVLHDSNFAKLQYSMCIMHAPLRSPKMLCIRSSRCMVALTWHQRIIVPL